jgi:carboxyl-terminal processing protease
LTITGKSSRQYPDFTQFNNKFVITDNIIDSIVAAGEKEGIERDQESIDFTMDMMKKEIKALIARDLFTRDHFFQVYNQDDKTILKALELLKDQKMFKDLLVKND